MRGYLRERRMPRGRAMLAVAAIAAQAVAVIITAPAARATDTSGFSPTLYSTTVQVAAGARATVSVSCPAGTTPIAGGVQTPLGTNEDVVHDQDYVNWGDGANFAARVRNDSDHAAGVTAWVRCVTWGRLTASSRVVATFNLNASTHVAGGVVSCPAGSYALSARVSWNDTFSTPSIDYSGPTWDLRGWRVAGTKGDAGTITVDVQCVSSAGLPGAYLVHVQQYNPDPTSIYPTLTATCPAGMAPVNGGSYTDEFDQGVLIWTGTAYSSYPTATGWATQGVLPNGATMYATAWCIPNQEPVLTISGPRPIYTNSTTAQFQFTATDPASAGGYTLSFQCALDGGPLAACQSPWTTTVTTEGHHTATGKVTTSDGRSASTTYDWIYDKTAPTGKTTAPRTPFTLAAHVRVGWTGSDGSGTGVRLYNVRYRTATYKEHNFTTYRYPARVQGVTTTSTRLGSAPGVTSCYSVQAVDRATNTSPYSAPRCTARPVDDRTLKASRGWTSHSSAASWNGTYRRTTTHHATLTLTRVHLDRVGVVATTCPGCGKVAILVAGSQIGTINLAASTTHYRVIRALPPFSPRSGNVVIKVTSTGKRVDIDALATSHA